MLQDATFCGTETPHSAVSENGGLKNVLPTDRGGGVKTTPLATRHGPPDSKFTTGMSIYPKGKGAFPHRHNCDEQVTLLGGEGECEVDGVITPLLPYDSTYIPAGKIHASATPAKRR